MNDQNLVVALTALLYDGRPPTLAPDLSILPIGLYARLSRNPDGTKESSAIQLEIGRRAAANAWPERKLLEFSDDDKSAANEEVWREHFYQLAKQVNDGQLGLVLVKEQTRLSRHKLIWPLFCMICVKAGIDVIHTFESGLATTALVGEGSVIGDITNSQAAIYAYKVKLNVNLHLLAHANNGEPSGGICAGYERCKNDEGKKSLRVLPVHDKAINDAARRIIKGTSVGTIAREWNKQKLPAAKGGKWTTQNVKSLLTCPMVTGLRAFKDEVIGEGNWTPILDRDTWYAVKATLATSQVVTGANGKTTTRNPQRAERSGRFTYTGRFTTCGRCEGAFTATLAQKVPTYRCAHTPGQCGRVAVSFDRFEDHVDEVIVRYLNTPALQQQFVMLDPDAQRRERIMAAKAARLVEQDEYARQVINKELTVAFASRLAANVEQAITELDQELESLRAPLPPEFDPSVVAESWATMPVDMRRAVLSRIKLSIVVQPGVRGARFDSSRIEISADGSRID